VCCCCVFFHYKLQLGFTVSSHFYFIDLSRARYIRFYAVFYFFSSFTLCPLRFTLHVTCNTKFELNYPSSVNCLLYLEKKSYLFSRSFPSLFPFRSIDARVLIDDEKKRIVPSQRYRRCGIGRNPIITRIRILEKRTRKEKVKRYK